jgi:hypothetical protein
MIYFSWIVYQITNRCYENCGTKLGIQGVNRQLAGLWNPWDVGHRIKALERWKTKVRNCAITPQYIWPVAESIMKRDEPKTPTVIHGPSSLNYYLREKANTTAECLVITSYPMISVTKKQWAAGGGYSSSTVRSCRQHPPGIRCTEINRSLQLRKACEINCIQNEHLRNLPRRPLVLLAY